MQEPKIKDGRIINLVDGTSKHLTLQPVSGVLLTAFSLICSKNQEQKADVKI